MTVSFATMSLAALSAQSGPLLDRQTALVLGLMLLMILMLVGAARRRMRRKPNFSQHELMNRADLARVRESAEKAMLSNEQTFREMTGILTTKLALLERLIGDADRCIVELRRLKDEPADDWPPPLSAKAPIAEETAISSETGPMPPDLR